MSGSFGWLHDAAGAISNVLSLIIGLTGITGGTPGDALIVGPSGELEQQKTRIILAAATTFFVRTDGVNISGNGKVDAAGQAYLTFQFAYNDICSIYDTGGNNFTIMAGNEAGLKTFVGPAVTQSWTGGGNVTLSGQGSARTKLTENAVFVGNGDIFINCTLPGTLTVTKFDFQGTAGNPVTFFGIIHAGSGTLVLGDDIFIEAMTNGQGVSASATGATVIIPGSSNIGFGAGSTFLCGISAANGATIADDGLTTGGVISYQTGCAMTRGLFYCLTSGNAGFNIGILSFSGTFTGPPCQVDSGGFIRFSFGYNIAAIGASGGSQPLNHNGVVQLGPNQAVVAWGSAQGPTSIQDPSDTWGIEIATVGTNQMWNQGGYGWTTAASVSLSNFAGGNTATESAIMRESANRIGYRNIANGTAGGHPTKFSFYNYNSATQPWFDPTDFERFVVDWQASANIVFVGSEAGGAGVRRPMRFLSPVGLPNYTVATLPSASTEGAGAFAFVTDATLTAITGLGLSPTGGGTNKVPVYSDGTNWIIL